jgi:hypothetical protein
MLEKNAMNSFANLTEKISEFLKKHGFQKKQHRWMRARSDLIDLIQLQPSRGSDSESVSFTMNFGLLSPRVYETLVNKPVPKFPSPVDGYPEFRIGFVIGENDLWWDIPRDGDLDSFAAEIIALIEAYVFPVFETCENESELNLVALRMQPWMQKIPANVLASGIVDFFAGERDRGIAKIACILNDRKASYWHDVAQRILHQFGASPTNKA